MTSTYAKRPAQSDRLGQPPQKRPSRATAPAMGRTIEGGVAIETTLPPQGAMLRDIRLNRAEQSSGSEGKSSDRQAPNKTSAGVASGKAIVSSKLHYSGGHNGSAFDGVAVVQPADAQVAVSLSRRASPTGPSTTERYPGWVCALIVMTLIAVTWAGVYFIVTAALSLGSGS